MDCAYQSAVRDENAEEGHTGPTVSGVKRGRECKRGFASVRVVSWSVERTWTSRERTAGPAGCCISHALASVTSLPSLPAVLPHRRGLNTFHVGIFNFMAANYSGSSPAVAVRERADVVNARTNSPRHFTKYAREPVP